MIEPRPTTLLSESVITLEEASEMLPNKPAHSTVWRWTTKGLQHRNSDEPILLESVKLGRQRVTSIQAMERFLRAISD